MPTMVMADWSRLEQKFEDGFEKLYKVLGLPFERNEFLNVDSSANNNGYRSENSGNTATSSKNPLLNTTTTTKYEGRQNWNSSYSILLNDQTVDGSDESIQYTPFFEVVKKAVELEGTPIVRSIASECKPKEEVKPDEVIDEGLVMIDSEKFTKEAWEAIAYALKMAASMQQKAETEHLMRALLEQKQGLVSCVLNEVSIDIALLLKITNEFIQCPPKSIGEENGSVIGRELAALLQRAMEWKEEYGDFLVSTEHLLLGFNLDNRVGKQLFKEGNAVDISFKILDAIDVMRKSQVFMNQEETCEVLKNYIDGENQEYFDGENQEYIDARVMEVTKFHQVSVLNESSIKRGELITCKNGLGELANYGAKVNTCKGLAAFEVKHRVIDEQSTEMNLIILISNEPTLFDEMPKREHLLCKAMILKFFREKKLDYTLDLRKKENIWTPLAMLTQSNWSNVVGLLDKILNASSNFSIAIFDLAGVFLKGLDEGTWVHSFLEDNKSDCDMVIGKTMEAVLVINTQDKYILRHGPMVALYNERWKAPGYLNHSESTSTKLNQEPIFVFDPGGS
ncbi:hypothetical protein LguiA_027395 [Lonicera macranthoides]